MHSKVKKKQQKQVEWLQEKNPLVKKKKRKAELDHRGQKLKIAKSTSRVLAVCHTQEQAPETHSCGTCYLQNDLKCKSTSEDIICIT